MISCLISILILAVIFAVVWWIAQLILGHFGVPGFVLQAFGAVLGLILLLYLLLCFTGGAGPLPAFKLK